MSNRRVSQGSIQHGLRMQLLVGALPHGLSPAPHYPRLPTPGTKKRERKRKRGKGEKTHKLHTNNTTQK